MTCLLKDHNHFKMHIALAVLSRSLQKIPDINTNQLAKDQVFRLHFGGN